MKTVGWEGRLIEYLAPLVRADYVPGDLDCAMFAGGAIEAMTGVDPGKKYRKKYKTVAGGLRALNRDGYKDHVDFAAKHFEEWSSPLMAQRGDLVMLDSGQGDALGIVQGSHIYAMGANGLLIVDLINAKRAFKI